eukprot:TRINITY_DN16348_c0_g1_i1.p1 TRINITY_DN16348_c0_g1~~TRINITY_DN16348_c0_g1_i1.p1  ORF type:complete len:336 (-),score=89.52 TRINITY_DN16348_c0_g1_i1:193-1134(-)
MVRAPRALVVLLLLAATVGCLPSRPAGTVVGAPIVTPPPPKRVDVTANGGGGGSGGASDPPPRQTKSDPDPPTSGDREHVGPTASRAVETPPALTMGAAACEAALQTLTSYAAALAAAECADAVDQAARLVAAKAAEALLVGATDGAADGSNCTISWSDAAIITWVLMTADRTKLCVAADAPAEWETGFPTDRDNSGSVIDGGKDGGLANVDGGGTKTGDGTLGGLVGPVSADDGKAQTEGTIEINADNGDTFPPPACCPTFELWAPAVCCTSECRALALRFSWWFTLNMCCSVASNVVPAHQVCPSGHVYEV